MPHKKLGGRNSGAFIIAYDDDDDDDDVVVVVSLIKWNFLESEMT